MELGHVKAFLSPEMGLIQLKETGRTVLFHLDQVWSFYPNTDDQSEASPWKGRPIRGQLEKPELEELLPIDTEVRVSHRQLPASPRSPLRCQAIMVVRAEEGGEEKDGVQEEFTQRFGACEQRIELVDELNELYDLFKTIQYPDPDSQHVLDYHRRLVEEEDFESVSGHESGEEDGDYYDDDIEEESSTQFEKLNKIPDERAMTKMSLGSSISSTEEYPLETKKTAKNMSDIEQELKSKDLRSLIGTYFNLLQQQASTSINNERFDFAASMKKSSRFKRHTQFFEDFCQALYGKCEDVRKGFKVGSIFVSQVQVNLVLKHGSNIPGHNTFKKDMNTVSF